MRAALLLVAVVALLLFVPAAAATDGHYVPATGDQFSYFEQVTVENGTGLYAGYVDNTFTNGSLSVTATAPNETDSAHYSYAWTYANNSGGSLHGSSAGDFTFSAASFYYVDGTDNQTGYTAPVSVWFYINDELPEGGDAVLLNTPVTVESTDHAYQFPTNPSRYVETLSVEGTGSYERDDSYGIFNAAYTWWAFFDPSTGYIVGYDYVEHDTNTSAGDSFWYSDVLSVTSTSYALTPAGAPPASGSSASGLSTVEIAAIVIVVLLVVVLIVVLALRSRRRPALAKHSATGSVAYRPVAPVAPPPSYGPPPIHLTPAQEPAVQQVVLRETVKVNCRYCGTLIDSTATVCPNCGAPRT